MSVGGSTDLPQEKVQIDRGIDPVPRVGFLVYSVQVT